jgi:hypothetical protein
MCIGRHEFMNSSGLYRLLELYRYGSESYNYVGYLSCHIFFCDHEALLRLLMGADFQLF